MNDPAITPERCALVAVYPTASAAWLASARIAANRGPVTDVRPVDGEWALFAIDATAAHEAERHLCAVTDHGQRDSRGSGWWHAEGVTRHLVCSHCGAGMHDVDAATMPAHAVLSFPAGSRRRALVPCNAHPWA